MKIVARIMIVLVSLFAFIFLSYRSVHSEHRKDCRFEANWESLRRVNPTPDWFIDAKFGIYTHWGPTSNAFVGMEPDQHLAGWHGMYMWGKNGSKRWQTGEVDTRPDGTPNANPNANYLHHVKIFGDPSEYGYDYLIRQFRPSGFDAGEWADVFASSGARFAGPVAMHHDNFAMWDSKTTRWNSMNYGGLDIAGELKKEIEARGMKFMASFHHAFTWKFFAQAHDFNIDPANYDLYTDPHDIMDQPSQKFCESWWAKLKEFIDDYEPDLLWFDWWLENLDESDRTKFLAYYYNKGLEWGKEVAVCYKESTFNTQTAIKDYERGRPNQIQRPPWLTDTSPGTWFYRSNARFVKTNEIIDILVDIVSKNGCMLLNVPPDPDGTIPEVMKTMLSEIGDWLEVNGEAIYGTRTWDVFGEGPTRLPSGGHKIEEKAKIEYTNRDIRFTKKSDTEFFAIILDTPEDEITIRSLSTYLGLLNSDIRKIELLGSGDQIRWERNEEGLTIKAPSTWPTRHAHAFRIELGEYQEADIDGEI
jgi:alpha-L-fucosidase